MTRAARVAIGSSILTFFYLLAFFSYIPVPFVDKAQTEQVLPVVRGATHYSDISDAYPSRPFSSIAALVAACVIWFV